MLFLLTPARRGSDFCSILVLDLLAKNSRSDVGSEKKKVSIFDTNFRKFWKKCENDEKFRREIFNPSGLMDFFVVSYGS